MHCYEVCRGLGIYSQTWLAIGPWAKDNKPEIKHHVDIYHIKMLLFFDPQNKHSLFLPNNPG